MKINPVQTLKDRCVANSIHHRSHGLKISGLTASIALLALLAFFVTGCETDPRVVNPSSPGYASVDLFPLSTNLLHEADVISIDFRYSTNFNTLQKIGPDGLVNLQSVGQVMAAGKTVTQFQDELVRLYKDQAKDDPITIKIVAAAATVYVTGAVNHPGKIVMDRPMTVVEAIAEAGGADPYRAKLSKVSVMRVEDRAQKIYWLNLNHILEGKDPDLFYLKPFDVVCVPAKTFNF